jgi:uncharacterized protein (DUF305 family)
VEGNGLTVAGVAAEPVAARGVPARFQVKAWLAAAALGAALAVVAAFVAGTLVASPRAPQEGSAEAGFARDMAVHHTQAVEMAMIAFQRSGDARIRAIAYDIALSQQEQLGRMHRWLDEWHLPLVSPTRPMAWMRHQHGGVTPGGAMPGMATGAELDALRTLTGAAFDVQFCRLMIRHHAAGMHMAGDVLSQARVADVRLLAEGMYATQRREIETLRRILDEHGAKP